MRPDTLVLRVLDAALTWRSTGSSFTAGYRDALSHAPDSDSGTAFEDYSKMLMGTYIFLSCVFMGLSLVIAGLPGFLPGVGRVLLTVLGAAALTLALSHALSRIRVDRRTGKSVVLFGLGRAGDLLAFAAIALALHVAIS
jgi:hypothetical protein